MTVAVLNFCTAAALITLFSRDPSEYLWGLKGFSILAGAVAFLGACVLVFVKPRLGYAICLAAGAMVLSVFVRSQIAREPYNSWIALNFSSPTYMEMSSALLFVKLELLSVVLLVTSTVCAALRLVPARLHLGKPPLRECTWPALAVSFLILAAWFVHSVTLYRVPFIADGGPATLRMLHVQKRGLNFHENAIWVVRNRAFGITRTDRRLFQYDFVSSTARGVLSQEVYDHMSAMLLSPDLLKLHTPPATTLWSWNADGWYLVLDDSRQFAFTTELGNGPPQAVIELFREIKKLHAGRERSFTQRDVCMGFCYGPAAAMGIVYPNQGVFRLTRSTSLSTRKLLRRSERPTLSCGKSAPRAEQSVRHGKPHAEQDQIGEEERPAPFDSRVGCTSRPVMAGPEE